MRIAKIHIILLILTISFIYSSFIIILFSYLHNLILGLSASIFSFLFLLIIGYHLLNYLFYLNYKKLVFNSGFLNEQIYKNHLEVSFNYNSEYFRYELKNYFNLKNIRLDALEIFDDFDILVMSKKDVFFEWNELIFCKIHIIENNHTLLSLYYNFDDDSTISSFVSYFKNLDVINFNFNKN